jgi:hypothetical protein
VLGEDSKCRPHLCVGELVMEVKVLQVRVTRCLLDMEVTHCCTGNLAELTTGGPNCFSLQEAAQAHTDGDSQCSRASCSCTRHQHDEDAVGGQGLNSSH